MADDVEARSATREAHAPPPTASDAVWRYSRLKSAIDGSSDLIVVLDRDFRFVDFNSAYAREFAKFIGVAPRLGEPLFDAQSAAKLSQSRANWERALAGERFAFEQSFVRDDGSELSLQFFFDPVRDEAGEIVGVCQVARDVTDRALAERQLRALNAELERRVAERTCELEEANAALRREILERREAEAALRASEEAYRGMFEVSGVGKTETDVDGSLQRVNGKFCQIVGYDPDELLGRSFLEITHPDDRANNGAEYRRLAIGLIDEYRVEKRYVRKNGEIVWVQVTATMRRDAEGRPVGCVAAVEDVTERRRAGAALRDASAQKTQLLLELEQERARLAAILEHLPAGVMLTEAPSGRIAYVNRAFERAFGRDWPHSQSVEDYEEWRLRRPDGSPFSIGDMPLTRALRGEDVIDEEVVAQTSAEDVHMLVSAAPIREPDGSVGSAVLAFLDITDRKRIERALRRSEERIRELVEEAADAIFVADADNRYVDVNAAACALLGYERDALLGRRIEEFIPPEEAPRLHADQEWEAQTGRSRVAEWTLLREDGRGVPVEVSAKLLPDGRWQAIARDISDRRRAEERQKLLVAELNHRVKNTLAKIQSLVAQTGRRAASVEELAAAIETRLAAMARAHELLTRSHWEGASLRALAEDELAPYRSQDGANLAIDGPEDIVLKPAAALALGMALHELATNAAKYGALSVVGGRTALSWTRTPDGGLALRWEETGGPAVQLEPQKGFGVALIERGLTYELGGVARLDFRSEGVTCIVEIPVSQLTWGASPPMRSVAMESAPVAREQMASASVSESLRILVVEDSALVALEIEDTLRAAGWTPVGPAARLDDALSLARAEALDGAVLDVNLDGEYVFAVADLLAARGVPFVFATGYDAAGVLPERFRGAPCVQKPFRGEALTQLLRDCMEFRP